MGKEDYAATGGALKLKGSAGVIKKKKKKKSVLKSKPTSESPSRSASPSVVPPPKSRSPSIPRSTSTSTKTDDILEPFDAEVLRRRGKTETEIRFEERRHKMLYEKLKKEGVKSHKEKVEEYNKYLASLSEHHDMPRIGPG
ncbi:DUF1754-domain-containing protein [Ascodesmis nigricans]|uniref:DUF1754-domain-containing protein n=1 Tax=Ascodesmis nigricans TaxID=341454 RepID=A0A4S2N3Y3_9PEZI|nr:DUF1754-domain-containing protein [Ascodesmis nigricans]